MDRRDFVKVAGTVAMAAAVPGRVWSSLSGRTEEEIEKRIAELLSKMTLDEKIEQMAGKITITHMAKRMLLPNYADTWDTPENKRLDIPSFKCVDGPRGVGTGETTCFPQGMMRGATWDPELEEKIGDVMGYEARSKNVNVVLSPCINVLWHPKWGRAQETYGEDPLHLGKMGAAHVVGLQKHVMATPKHFAANNIEDSRFYVNVSMEERTLREIYLPHFKMCVDAGAASIMSAYNDLMGELCAHNEFLLRHILKGEWGFDGFVMSDWIQAVEDATEAANGGLDLEMPTPENFGRDLKKAVKAGKVTEETIDEAVTRILRAKLRYITPDFTEGYDRGKIASSSHVAVALDAARKGITLLKNDGGALPLSRGAVEKIVVAGKLADDNNTGDRGSSAVRSPYVVTPLQGLKEKAGNVKIDYAKTKMALAAKADGADAIVVVAGYNWKDEGEFIPIVGFGGDRDQLGLNKDDIEMIEAAAGLSDRVIVVLMGGSAITMEGWHDKAEAIVMAWYAGMEGGTALAEVLFGDVNPSGRLPIVFPRSEGQLYEFDNEAEEVWYDYYHGYRYFDKKGLDPLYHFGHGLSYTTYEFSDLEVSPKKISEDGKIKATVKVKNTGDAAGEEVVQLYVGYEGPAVDRPVKDLKAFGRVALSPGEEKTVTLEVAAQDLAYYDQDRASWTVEKIGYKVLVGQSSKKEDLLEEKFRIA